MSRNKFITFIATQLKNFFYDKFTIDQLTIKKEQLATRDYVHSFLKASKKIISCFNKRWNSPADFFIRQIFCYRFIAPMSVIRFFNISNKKMSHYTYDSYMRCINELVFQEGFFSRVPKILMNINRFRHLSLFRSNLIEGQYLILSSKIVDLSKIQQMEYSVVQSNVNVLSFLEVIMILIKGSFKFVNSLEYLNTKLVNKIEILISYNNIKRLGTTKYMAGVDFLENPVFQACNNKGAISFGWQQRAFNFFQFEFRYAYYHEYSYWDKESMRIHSSVNHVQNSLINYPKDKLKINTDIKKIIAFPCQHTEVLCSGSFNNTSMANAFANFLQSLTNCGYKVIVKPKDLKDRDFWENKGFDVVTSPRGDYMNTLKNGFCCAVTSVLTTPGLEIALKTTIPSFYYSDNTIPSEYSGYDDMLVKSPSDLFEKLGVKHNK